MIEPKLIPPDPPLTKEGIVEVFSWGIVRRRLMTREELQREFPDLHIGGKTGEMG